MTVDEMASRLYFEARLALIGRPDVRLYNRDPQPREILRGPHQPTLPRKFKRAPEGLLEIHADVPDQPVVHVALLNAQEVWDRGVDRIRERGEDLARFIQTGDHRPAGTGAGQGTIGAVEYRRTA